MQEQGAGRNQGLQQCLQRPGQGCHGCSEEGRFEGAGQDGHCAHGYGIGVAVALLGIFQGRSA